MQNQQCSFHSNHKIDYLCMDASCEETVKCCIICIKRKHKKCAPENLISAFQKNSTFVNKFPEVEFFELFEASLILKSEIVLNSFHEYFKKSINSTFPLSGISQSSEVEKFQEILLNKRNFIFEVNADETRITVKALAASPEFSKESKDMFSQSISGLIQTFLKKINMMGIYTNSNKETEDFLVHENMKLSKIENRLKLEVTNEGQQYFLCILKKPIEQSLKLKFTVAGLNLSDRYVEVGLMDEDTYKEGIDGLIGSFDFGKYTYSGYSSKGFSGSLPTSALDSDLGLKEASVVEFWVNYAKGQFGVGCDGKVDLKGDLENSKEKLFLYFCLYFVGQSIEIEFIDN